MKKYIKIIVPVILLGTCSLSFSSSKNRIEKFANCSHQGRELTVDDIIEFEKRTGHEVIELPKTPDGIIWINHTLLEDGHLYLTTVYTDGTQIVKYEDEIIE